MIGGVNFQPGAQDRDAQPNSGSRPSGSSQGVQEAIKVLSLRLPKVVGAQAAAPSALLQSQGSNGNSRVDSIVESVLGKFFPQASQQPQPQGAAPMMPVESMRNAYGSPQAAQPERQATAVDRVPRMVFDGPTGHGDFTTGPGGWPVSPPPMNPPGGVDGGNPFPPATIAPPPDLRRQLDWLPAPDAGRPYEI